VIASSAFVTVSILRLEVTLRLTGFFQATRE
jgi:hypothetical protein